MSLFTLYVRHSRVSISEKLKHVHFVRRLHHKWLHAYAEAFYLSKQFLLERMPELLGFLA